MEDNKDLTLSTKEESKIENYYVYIFIFTFIIFPLSFMGFLIGISYIRPDNIKILIDFLNYVKLTVVILWYFLYTDLFFLRRNNPKTVVFKFFSFIKCICVFVNISFIICLLEFLHK